MKDEIISGIRNAMEKGESLEAAAQSFINAGYNPFEVKEAARMISAGATQIATGGAIKLKERNELPQMPKPPEQEFRKLPNVRSERFEEDNKRKILIILIIAAMLILLSVSSYLIYVLIKS